MIQQATPEAPVFRVQLTAHSAPIMAAGGRALVEGAGVEVFEAGHFVRCPVRGWMGPYDTKSAAQIDEVDLALSDHRCTPDCLGLDIFDVERPCEHREEIERCGDCAVFPSDEHAVQQLRIWLGGLHALVAASRAVWAELKESDAPVDLARLTHALEPFDGIVV